VTDLFGPLRRMPRERAADLVTAAAYGTVLVLGALAFVAPEDVADGHGIELVAGVGVATWVAHAFADIVGEHVRHVGRLPSHELRWSLVSGTPILAASVLPAVAIGLGRLEMISDELAIWTATTVAVVQMVGVGATVGVLRQQGRRTVWAFVVATGIFGLGVTAVKIQLGH
jgi:hypothetical protein